MRHRRRKSKKYMKTAVFIILPVITVLIINNSDRLKEKKEIKPVNRIIEQDEIVTNESNPNDDILCGSLILSHGYGVKPEIEQGENYLILPSPLETKSDDKGEVPYPENFGGGGELIRTTFGEYIGDSFFNLADGGQVNNKTEIPNQILINDSWFMPNFTIENTDEPLVLLYHTHTCESYEPYVRDEYDLNFNYRTTDENRNMVMVGNAIQAELETQGIGVVHASTIHDHPSYNGAYDRSRETILSILEEYPSIKIVLDIHRDALSEENTAYQPFIRVEGKECAQIMIISGCDDGTMGMPNYMENFHFACALQQKLETDHPGFTRPVLFDYRCYNQDLTNGSLLVEIGSFGNTLEQSQFAGQLFGKSLGEFINSLKKGD